MVMATVKCSVRYLLGRDLITVYGVAVHVAAIRGILHREDCTIPININLPIRTLYYDPARLLIAWLFFRYR